MCRISGSRGACAPLVFRDLSHKKTQKTTEVCRQMRTAWKCVNNKKLSIFFKFWWNLVKMTSSWLGQIAEISAWYYQKCWFFVNDTFLSKSTFACLRLYNFWGSVHLQNDLGTPSSGGCDSPAWILGKTACQPQKQK